MKIDQKDTVEDQKATDTDAQEEQVDDTDTNASQDDENEQESSPSERLYAGKYSTLEELETAYKEIQRFTGGRRILEDKANAYDRLVASQAQSVGQPVKGRPQLSSYITEDGAIDTVKYDADMDVWESSSRAQSESQSIRAAQEQIDMRQAESDFPYLLTDKIAARAVMAGYHSGEFKSVYDSAKDFDEYRSASAEAGKTVGSEAAKREMSKKIRGNTERSTGKTTDTGEMTEEKFAKLPRNEQRKYLIEKGIIKNT